MTESEKNSTHAATWAESRDGNSDRQGAYSFTDSIMDSPEIQDHFAYLVNSGIPLDVIERHRRDGLSYEQQAEAVAAMISRGESLDEIIGEETGEPPEAQPPPSPSLSIISAVDLQRQDIPPLKWTVEGFLPTGTAVWASPPKFGKSWAALDLCLSVTTGGRFLGYRCNKSGALYLCLEDSLRRVRSRMEKLLAGACQRWSMAAAAQ